MKQADLNAARSKYNDDSIQTLDALAHIRQRSGMYIGRLGDGSHPDDGIYVMFKEGRRRGQQYAARRKSPEKNGKGTGKE